MLCTTYSMERGSFGGVEVQHEPFPHIRIGDARFLVAPWAISLRGLRRPILWHKPIEAFPYETSSWIEDASIGAKYHKGKLLPCCTRANGKQEDWRKRLVHVIAAQGFSMVDLKQNGVTLLAHGMSGPNSQRVHEYLVILRSGTKLELLAPKRNLRWHMEFERSGDRLRGYEPFIFNR